MKSVLAGTVVVLIVSVLASGQAQSQEASAGRFVGEWVGLQTWAIDNPPPNVRAPQPVTVKIEVIDGNVVGVIMPFMGGSDGASFVDGRVIGDALKGTGVMGTSRLPNGAPASGNPRWKAHVNVDFSFTVTGGSSDELIGTADVLMGDVQWIKYKYELKKKRSRY